MISGGCRKVVGVGDFYGFKSAGIFAYDESNAFTDKWEQLTPVFENGVFQYKYLLDGKEYAGNIRQKTLPNGKPFRGEITTGRNRKEPVTV